MPGLEHTVIIAAPPEQVWSVVVDVERWPERIPTVDAVERLDAGPLAVGSRTRLQQPRLPTAVWTVTELADGSSYTWESSSPGVVVTATHVVEPHPRKSAHPRRVRVRSRVGDRLAAHAVADQAVRRDGGCLDQAGRRDLGHVEEASAREPVMAAPPRHPRRKTCSKSRTSSTRGRCDSVSCACCGTGNLVHSPSETTSTEPSTTSMAVCSSPPSTRSTSVDV